MIHGLVSGTISGTIKTGDKYTAGRLIVKAGTDVLMVGFIAFAADVRATLDDLTAGDAVSLSGEVTPKAYTDKAGNHRATINITVQAVLAPKH